MPLRVNGGVYTDQTLTGSLTHYLLLGADFSNGISDKSPISGSAAEEIAKVISQKSTIAIFSPYEIGISFALETNRSGWTESSLEEEIRKLGTAVGFDRVDLSNIRITEMEYKFIGSAHTYVVPDPSISNLSVNNTYFVVSDTTLTLPDYNEISVGSIIRIFKYEDTTVTINGYDSQKIKDLTSGILDEQYTYSYNEEIRVVYDGYNWSVFRVDNGSHNHKISDVDGLEIALSGKQDIAEKGRPNGYAPLDSSNMIPSIHLPSYVDDILEFDSNSNFPNPGEIGKIYVALDTNKIYRWSGTSYIEIASNIDNTDDVPEGVSNLYYTNERVDDRVSNLLVGTTDISLVYDDNNDTLTVGTTGTSSDTASRLVKRTEDNRFSITGIDFTNATTASAVGRLKWNDVDGTLDLGLKGGATTLQVGQELIVRALNRTGQTISNGTVVFITGAQENRVTIEPAIANQFFSHATVLGMATENILDNQEGFVTVTGLVKNLNTSAFLDGDDLWLSPTVSGGLTKIRPLTPNKSIYIGTVARSSSTDGIIFVRPDGNLSIEELSDVQLTGISTGDTLVWDGSSFGHTKLPVSTDDITEGTNLYYTDERVLLAVENRLLSNTLIVSDVSDLPAPIGDEHILPANTTVLIDGTVDLGTNALRLQIGTILRGLGNDKIITTNSLGAVRATNISSNVILREFDIISPNGPCLELTGDINYQLNAVYLGLFGERVGNITGFDVQSFKTCFSDTLEGLFLGGTTNKISIDGCPFYGITGTNAGITLRNDLVVDIIDITTNYFRYTSATALRAIAGYQLNKEANVRGCLIANSTTPLEGIDPSDPKWRMSNNTGIRDSKVAAVSVLSETTIIDIIEQNTFVPIQGNFVTPGIIERFEVLSNGALSYSGISPELVTIVVTIAAFPVAGDTINARLIKNGNPVPGGEVYISQSGNASATMVVSGTLTTMAQINPGDTVYVEIANITTSNDIELRYVSISITG